MPLLERVSPHLWRVAAARAESDEANQGVTTQLVLARDATRLWLVGSGPTPAFGRSLACAIERATGQAVTDVVNTRPQPESALGNVAFTGARLWALADVAAAMRQRCGACLDRLKARLGAAGDSLHPALIRLPTHRVAAPRASSGRLGPFRWLALQRGPGSRVLVLQHRRDRITIAQGMVWVGDIPNLREARLDTMAASLNVLQAFVGSGAVLGEQGDLGAAADVALHIAYLDALRQIVLAGLARGDAQMSSAAGAELPGFSAAPGYPRWHALNVQQAWRELEPTIFK